MRTLYNGISWAPKIEGLLLLGPRCLGYRNIVFWNHQLDFEGYKLRVQDAFARNMSVPHEQVLDAEKRQTCLKGLWDGVFDEHSMNSWMVLECKSSELVADDRMWVKGFRW